MALTREGLLNYFETRMGVNSADIQDETPLFSSNILDSFSMVDLIMFIEQESGTRVEPWEVTLDNLDSMKQILGFVDSKSL
jgi:acyl carrier protein